MYHKKTASPQSNRQYLSCSTRNPGERALQRDPFLRLCEDSDWKGWMLQTASRKDDRERERKRKKGLRMTEYESWTCNERTKRQTWQKSTIRTRCLVMWKTESLVNGWCNAETSWTWLSKKESSAGVCPISRQLHLHCSFLQKKIQTLSLSPVKQVSTLLHYWQPYVLAQTNEARVWPEHGSFPDLLQK